MDSVRETCWNKLQEVKKTDAETRVFMYGYAWHVRRWLKFFLSAGMVPLVSLIILLSCVVLKMMKYFLYIIHRTFYKQVCHHLFKHKLSYHIISYHKSSSNAERLTDCALFHTHMFTHTHKHLRTHTYTYTNIYIHTHTYTHSQLLILLIL